MDNILKYFNFVFQNFACNWWTDTPFAPLIAILTDSKAPKCWKAFVLVVSAILKGLSIRFCFHCISTCSTQNNRRIMGTYHHHHWLSATEAYQRCGYADRKFARLYNAFPSCSEPS